MKLIILGHSTPIATHLAHLDLCDVQIINSDRPLLSMAEHIKVVDKEHPDSIIIVESTAQNMFNEMTFPSMKDISLTVNNFRMDYPDIVTIKKEKSYSKYQKGRDKKNK